ncbi:MAG: HAMP domain-containing histidine kinase [Clostridiales bacterium]|nr:HAMP domain-containing histidine kinase [Clostridiales bacterium]
MRLWMKLTALSAAVIFVALGVSIAVFTAAQQAALRRTDDESARRALRLFCVNVTSVVSGDNSRMPRVSLRSIIDFYFAFYAHLLADDSVYYSLSQGGRYLHNLCPYDPASLFEPGGVPSLVEVTQGLAEIPVLRVPADGAAALAAACSFRESGQDFTAYICVDVSETDARIARMRWLSALILSLACLCAAALTAALMRLALRPVRALTDAALRIASGDYEKRTSVAAGDEIGSLSAAFDRMADSIEDKIRSLDAQLKKKQLLLGALAHEIRTPMTAIIGYADSLAHMPLTGEQRDACAQRILDAGRHTQTLCRKLMEFIGLTEDGRIERKRFPADRLADALRRAYPPNVSVTCETFDLNADEMLLLSLIGNLIDNAVKASPEDAPVDVRIGGDEGRAYITVTDSGRGIPPDVVSLVTEPFYRVDRARSRRSGGSGLGLALCQLIAERHGGSLAIDSRPGAGTRVTVTISQIDDISPTN